MKRMIAFAIAVFAFSAQATIVTVSLPVPPEVFLWHRATEMIVGYIGGGTWLRQVTITKAVAQIAGNSGGGAGNTVITFTDGTNTCTATFTCASTQFGTGLVSATIANGSGTGCTYAAGATVTSSVTTAGCTTTQPTLLLNFWGRFF